MIRGGWPYEVYINRVFKIHVFLFFIVQYSVFFLVYLGIDGGVSYFLFPAEEALRGLCFILCFHFLPKPAAHYYYSVRECKDRLDIRINTHAVFTFCGQSGNCTSIRARVYYIFVAIFSIGS